MVNKQLEGLRKRLAEVSQKSQKIEETKEEPEPAPTPIPVPKQEEDLTPTQMEQLTKQIEKIEQKEVPQEAEGSDEEDVERMQQIQSEIDRMQNGGAFRVELLYQLLGINANLGRIATAIEKVTGENA